MNQPDSHVDVVGLGQCSLDILGQLDDYPALDQKAELNSLKVQGGGPVATALVTLARLKVKTAFIGAVGDDDFGEKIRQELLSEKVDCSFLKTDCHATSQVALITVDSEGHRNIFWHRGTAVPELPVNFRQVLNEGTCVLHLDGLHLDAALEAASLARKTGVVTVLDAGTFRDGVEKLLPLIDHLVVSESFAVQATGEKSHEAALIELAGYNSEAVTITCGSRGSYSYQPGMEIVYQPAFDVDVVDTTGCGDVFHGGYIYGLLQGWTLPPRIRFAAACAALKARALGGRSSIPTLSEVNAFLKERTDV